MGSRIWALRADEVEVELWREIADASGARSLNDWARRALNDQAALDAALLRESADEYGASG